MESKMTDSGRIEGRDFARMVALGAENLGAHADEVNDLNVFPIPDGDTGVNMLRTIRGGVRCAEGELSEVSDMVSEGMLMSARGNSGVILSQFFDGIAKGFASLESADVHELGHAFLLGVEHAYSAVLEPTEGTILTVIREATHKACESAAKTPAEFMDAFIAEAKASLSRTPSLLPVLKQAGVVDSGGAGLVYIAEGMYRGLGGEQPSEAVAPSGSETVREDDVDLDAFDENSILTYGYCTELLVRLQRCKVDVESFDVTRVTEALEDIGDSVAAVKHGSILKLHVHTKTPDMVLSLCRKYGEFLKVKIENMSLQHNEIERAAAASGSSAEPRELKKFGVVAVACGEGIKRTFRELGADVLVDGGQSMNPSAEELLSAYREACAETVIVFPNNSNVYLAAMQAAQLCDFCSVRVIDSKTVGAGYAALSMLDLTSGDTETVVRILNEAMEGVETVEVSRCVRDAVFGGESLCEGDYIGFSGKSILSRSKSRRDAAIGAIDALGVDGRSICIILCGEDADAREADALYDAICEKYGSLEVYMIDGGQRVYDYVIVLE